MEAAGEIYPPKDMAAGKIFRYKNREFPKMPENTEKIHGDSLDCTNLKYAKMPENLRRGDKTIFKTKGKKAGRIYAMI